MQGAFIKFATYLLISVVFVLVSYATLAEERILSYDSHISVAADATMTVQETIQVVCENNQINHGIFREFPTKYRDQYGNRYVVGFEVLDVKRDGKSEPYHIEKRSNGYCVKIGSGDVVLPPATYTYTLTYETNRQLGFFEDHDELYWNATGTDWDFTIEQATATVSLPEGVPVDEIKVEGYTGYQGDQGQDYVAEVDERGVSRFASTRTLSPGEGLTIVVSFPKGYVHEPTFTEKLMWLLRDNATVLTALAGLIVLLLYYLMMWKKVGRDPRAGTIIPLYEPPEGFSPAAVRFLRGMGYDSTVMTAAVINCAVKGHATITEQGDKYLVTRVRSKERLAEEEAALLDVLVRGEGDSILIDKDSTGRLQSAEAEITKKLAAQQRNKYYITNTGSYTVGLLIALAVGAVVLLNAINTESFNVVAWICVFVMLVLTALFNHLLKAYTPQGRAILDRIMGFRMYLSVAERERLNLQNPPDRTPELFEMFLPYALALGVEKAWAAQFASVFAALSATGKEYHPAWYSGDSFDTFDAGNFSSSVGESFSGAIASSAHPSGSSSGGGGGGSSGGGGGGGGGGGW
jgi:uncharacterized membrane protein